MFGFKSNQKDIQELLKKGALVIDVRSPQEFASEHYSTAINIPLDTLQDSIEMLKSKKGHLLVVCHSGARSAAAVHMLQRAGVEATNAGSWRSL